VDLVFEDRETFKAQEKLNEAAALVYRIKCVAIPTSCNANPQVQCGTSLHYNTLQKLLSVR